MRHALCSDCHRNSTHTSQAAARSPEPVASGAAMSSAVRYWLLTEPLSDTLPDGSPSAMISTGGQPVPSVHVALTPSCSRGDGRGEGRQQTFGAPKRAAASLHATH